ncbi:YkgJ family cysteine cluster protein [Desulfococcus sp.]|uniref:YkgJ family cysteine cluster protein n=1 Tax=Desulfococcus sp. TaxID=2025834 RepID=UPI0035936507
MENELTPLSPDDVFTFSCTPAVACFNECCRNLNQFLTPYDILRLKNHLGLSSSVFLERHTVTHIGPETGLPVVVLRQDPASGMTCPFVSDRGCIVYEARPSSCRAYPLARLASRCRETGKVTEHYALMREPHCRGFREEKRQTVRQWIEDQGLSACNEMNDLLMEIIGLKSRLHPQPLDIRERHIFHLACYDLDAFRKQVFEKDLLKEMAPDPELLLAAENDDTVLLRLAMAWLKQTLFGKPEGGEP